jgi:hypothetical protein
VIACYNKMFKKTRSRPRKYGNVTRGSQKLHVRTGSCAGDPGGVSAADMGRLLRAGRNRDRVGEGIYLASRLPFLGENLTRLRQV